MGTIDLDGGIDREGWIKPGEPCIVYSEAGSYTRMSNVHYGEIDKVGKRDISVLIHSRPGVGAKGERFNGARGSYTDIDGFRYLKRYGSGIGSDSYYLVHPDSAMGQEAANRERIRLAGRDAERALGKLGNERRMHTADGSRDGMVQAEMVRLAAAKIMAAFARLNQIAEAKAEYERQSPRPEFLMLPDVLDLSMGPEEKR